jgi:hypothetical protein
MAAAPIKSKANATSIVIVIANAEVSSYATNWSAIIVKA